VLTAGAALAACVAAGTSNPDRGGGVPCPFHLVTGLWCPACGATRALHALVHGDLPEAMARNPLFVALLPVGAWLWMAWASPRLGGPTLGHLPRRRLVVTILVLVTVAFGVLRNLPVSWAHWLGPT